MNAIISLEKAVSDESRLVKLESDLHRVQFDVTEMKGSIKWLRESFESFKTEVAKEFGSVRVSIERARLWMVVTGLGTILSVWGAALALARYLKP